MGRLGFYARTAAHLRPSQIVWRLWRRLGRATPLRWGYKPKPDIAKANIIRVPALPELDFDPVFLSRFDADAVLAGELTLLHVKMGTDWSSTSWRAEGMTPLWRFNMHYHEYLLPLAERFLDTEDLRYLDGAKSIVVAWIDGNPRFGGGAGWDPYTISMRVVNWLAFYAECREAMDADPSFVDTMNSSLAEQYAHLSQNLEKDLLANHYLENLKAIVMLACYFADWGTLRLALPLLESQVAEQVLPDGVHFELSPMYQKVVLEDLLRACSCLRASGKPSKYIESRLQDMCDFVHSMERGTNRTPLFNDSGDNVAKSKNALLGCAEECFGIEPAYRATFPDAGYYLLEEQTNDRKVKVIFDAGQPGPDCAAGHAHCDMFSIEVFVDGEPLIVNSGTYAYQDERRLELKRTAAHSAPQVVSVEQSECWAPFRMAKMASVVSVEADEGWVAASMRDCVGNVVERRVELEEGHLIIADRTSASAGVITHLHVVGAVEVEGLEFGESLYCPEFGLELPSTHLLAKGESIYTQAKLPERPLVVVSSVLSAKVNK